MRTFRLVGVALLTIAALTLIGYGGLDRIQSAPSVAVAQTEAADSGHAQTPADAGHQPRDAHASAEEAGAPHGDSAHGAEHEEGGHMNPVLPVLALLMIVMLAAKLGGSLMERLGQPGVLGELVFGVILGNLTLVGITFWHDLMQLTIHFPVYGAILPAEGISAERIIHILGEIGVILLLFEVGLESNVKEMASVGLSSFLVALFGIIAPFFLGWGVSAWFLPEAEVWVHVFIGATLCATSVGITARVLKDLKRLQQRESKIVLGAAVIDDIMGLVILAVVMGLIQAANTGVPMSALSVGWIIGKALLFLILAIAVGQWAAPRLFHLASRLRGQHVLLTLSLLILFLLSYIANRIDLATIVGAFAAGLILDPVHYKEFKDRGEHSLEELLHPLTGFLVPIFFVRMGYMVDLTSFAETKILAFAGVLTLAAIVGKQVCSFGVVEKGLDKISVGIGMIPRGEVGLIFAGIGMTLILHGHRIVDDNTYSAVVIMVIVTTLITPPALKWSLNRPRGYEGASDDEMARIAAARREKRKEYFRSRSREEGEGRGGRRREGSGRDGGRGRRPRRGGGAGGAAAGGGGTERKERKEQEESREGAKTESGRPRGRRRRPRRRRGGGSGGSGGSGGGGNTAAGGGGDRRRGGASGGSGGGKSSAKKPASYSDST